MTDRELLEAAAKAAGIVITKWDPSGSPCYGRVEYKITVPWNPLTDDGDALRLAVKLRLSLDRTASTVMACDHQVRAQEDPRTGPYAATRRAIVRAAAELTR